MESEYSIIDSFTLFTSSTDKIQNNNPILSISSMEHINDKLNKLHTKLTIQQKSLLQMGNFNGGADKKMDESTTLTTTNDTSTSSTTSTSTTTKTSSTTKPTKKTDTETNTTSATNNFMSIVDSSYDTSSTSSSSYDTSTYDTSTSSSASTRDKTNKMPINSSIDTYLKNLSNGKKNNKKK